MAAYAQALRTAMQGRCRVMVGSEDYLVKALRDVIQHGLETVAERRGVSREEAARLIGEQLGLPGCQVLSWARNCPLGAPIEVHMVSGGRGRRERPVKETDHEAKRESEGGRQEYADAKRKENGAQIKANLGGLAKGLAKEPRLFTTVVGFYANAAWADKYLHAGGLSKAASRLGGATRTLGGWSYFGGWECYPVQVLIDAANRGAFGLSMMGALELVRLESVDDLEGEPGRIVGYVSQSARDAGYEVSGATASLADAFRAAKNGVILRRPSHPEGVIDRDAWAARDGQIERGPVRSLREALPWKSWFATVPARRPRRRKSWRYAP